MYQEKTIWIIGANSSIAHSFLQKYGNEFRTIILCGRRINTLNRIKEKYHLNNSELFTLDICSSENIENLVAHAPTPDIVINFVGFSKFANKKEDESFINIEKTFKTNAIGVIELFELIAKKMKSNCKKGIIINLGSIASQRGKYSNRFYSASKAAIRNYLQGLSQNYHSSHIVIVELELGRVKTKMLKNAGKSMFFASNCSAIADLIYSSIAIKKSKTIYQPGWFVISKLFCIIPNSVYNNLSF